MGALCAAQGAPIATTPVPIISLQNLSAAVIKAGNSGQAAKLCATEVHSTGMGRLTSRLIVSKL